MSNATESHESVKDNVATATQSATAEEAPSKKSATGEGKKATGRGRKKVKKIVTDGFAHILASFNNTMVTITDRQGNVLTSASAGGCGFRGSRKSTPFAGQAAAEKAGTIARTEHGMKKVEVYVDGPGPGREAMRALGLIITKIVDVTRIPHNGCRPPKRRRV